MGKTKPGKNTIRFKCIKCGAYLRVAEKLANRYIDCPKCKGRTGVPASQEEASDEGGEYGVKQMSVEVPEECDKCGQRLRKGTVFCTGCGYDFRKGKFVEAIEPPETGNAFVEWLQDINWGKAASALVILVILGGLGFFGIKTMSDRSSGKFINKSLFDSQISQISTEREILAVFGTPRERIKVVREDLGGDKFLSLERHADQIRGAGVNVDELKSQGYTWVTDIRSKDKTLYMVGQPGSSYFLYYANEQQAMMVLLEGAKVGNDEECNLATLLEIKDGGGVEISAYGMGPVIGAGGDMRGFYWTQVVPTQSVQPAGSTAGLTYDPQQCWNLWLKGELRDFRN